MHGTSTASTSGDLFGTQLHAFLHVHARFYHIIVANVLYSAANYLRSPLIIAGGLYGLRCVIIFSF